jgi:hypothetical protein
MLIGIGIGIAVLIAIVLVAIRRTPAGTKPKTASTDHRGWFGKL